MNLKTALLFSLVALFATVVVRGAERPEIPLLTLESRLFPSLELDGPPSGLDDSARVNIDNFQTRIALPWRVKTETSMLTAVFGYESLFFDYENWNESADLTVADQLYAFQLAFSWRKKLVNPKKSLSAFLTPGFNSDFKGEVGRAFRIQGGMLLNHDVGRGTWSYGLVLINNFGAPQVFPALSYMGKLTDRQTVMIRLPVLVSWDYSLNSKLELGLTGRVAGNNYHIGEQGPNHNQNVRYSATTVGPTLKWKPASFVMVLLESGWMVNHKLEYWDRKTRVRDLDFKSGTYLGAGLRFFLK